MGLNTFKMITQALENSVRLMDYQLPKEGEQDLINELYNLEQDLEKNFIDPFSRELTINLLNKESQDGIRIVLKHYINMFLITEVFFDNNRNILFDNNYLGNGTAEYCIPQFVKDSKLSRFESYVIIAHYLFDCHFYCIQDCCITHKIDFFKLCRELHFKLDLISTGITKSYIETEDLIHSKNKIMEKDNDPLERKSIEDKENGRIENKQQSLEIGSKFIGSDPNSEQIFSEMRSSENHFWKGLPMGQVIKHFKVMTKRESKNGNVFLTVEQLISFLRKGFLNDQTQPKQKINCSYGEKGFVIKRFYDLYVLAVSQYSYPSRKKKFIDLFNDCFDNWESHTTKQFFRPNKTKETW